MSKTILKSFKAISTDSWNHFRNNIFMYCKAIFFMFGGLVVAGMVGNFLAMPVNNYLNTVASLTYAEALSISLIAQSIFLIFTFFWLSFCQGLLLHISLRSTFKNFREILKHFIGDYGKFLSLALFLIIIGLLAMVPYYGISIVVFFDLPAGALMSNILLIIFIALMVNIPWIFVFTPFIMLDKHIGLFKTLKYNFQIIKGNGLRIFGFILIPLIVLFLLNLFLTFLPIPNVALLINLFSLFLIVPLTYSYLSVLYLKFSAGK